MNIETPKQRFLSICNEKISRQGINDLLTWMSNEEKCDFFTAPASSKFHSNFESGLCEHSIKVYEILLQLAKLYLSEEEFQKKQESIAIIALFHDLCKANFYKKGSRNVKGEDGKWYAKEIWEIDEKVPLGHGEKSCMLLQQYMKLNPAELMAIRYHMGGFDNAVKGGDFAITNAFQYDKLIPLLHVADLISSYLFEEIIK